jgi:HEAT repeat protein
MPILRSLSLLLVVGAVIAPLLGEDAIKSEGMDVIKAGKALKEALSSHDPRSARGKPWAEDIAHLTHPAVEIHTAAMASLMRRGEPVVPDLIVLAGDPDWELRSRVVAVLATIGGDHASATVIKLCDDPEPRVAEVAILGLGQCKGPGTFERLVLASSANDPNRRQMAAKGFALHGDPRALRVLVNYPFERDDLVKRDMRENLARVANQARAIPVIIELCGELSGPRRLALLEATAGLGDPRLCPALTALLRDKKDVAALALTARVLSVNGDSRCVQSLCELAASGPTNEIREYAANTLRVLTGYSAAPGTAWTLWWRDNSAIIEQLIPRDTFLAALYDPERQATREELQQFPVEQLSHLLEGVLGRGAPWWGARAYAALRQDNAARWTGLLHARITQEFDAQDRVRLIMILDELGDPAAVTVFKQLYDELRAQPAVKAHALGPERLALAVALERRGVPVE